MIPPSANGALENRGIDFNDAGQVFAGETLTQIDDRQDYGETRFQTYGFLDGRMVMMVWTWRGEARHVISMRFCHEREANKVRPFMG